MVVAAMTRASKDGKVVDLDALREMLDKAPDLDALVFDMPLQPHQERLLEAIGVRWIILPAEK
jgi:hypothetical protein